MGNYNSDNSGSSADVGGYEINTNYRVFMKKGSMVVSTPMSENFSTQLDIGWTPMFANAVQEGIESLTGGTLGSIAQKVQAAGGVQFQNKKLSAHLWSGTSYLALNIPFIFKVQKDPKAELLDPIKTLMRMALPSVWGKIGLSAPYNPILSPSLTRMINWGDADSSEPVKIYFGKFFKLEDCVITNISKTYDAIFNKQGLPLSAKIDVSVISTYIITREDVENSNGLFGF